MRVEITKSIDLEVSARELAESYVNGNHNLVVERLANDHAGLTALLLVGNGPLVDGVLSRSDCISIANRLIDARAEHCM